MPVLLHLIKGNHPRFIPYEIMGEELEVLALWLERHRNSSGFTFHARSNTAFQNMLQPKGSHTIVAAVKDTHNGQFAGVGIISKKKVFINGSIRQIAYVSELFIQEKYRNKSVFGLLFRILFHYTKDCTGYLSTVMEDNNHLFELLLQKRRGMIQYRDLGKLKTMVITPQAINVPAPTKGIKTMMATVSDLDALLHFRAQQAGRHTFLPFYTKEDITNSSGILRDLCTEDILLAKRGHEIVGCVAIWDQSYIKTWVPDNYPFWLNLVRPALNLFLKIKGSPTLPKAGEPVSYLILSMLTIREDDINIFRALLQRIKERTAAPGTKGQLLVLMMHQKNPLLSGIDFTHYTIKSRLIFAANGEDISVDHGIPYVELGAL